MHLSETPFVVVDTETTGVRPASDRLIEIAAVRLVGGETAGEFSALINPGCAIPHRITRITGISTGMVYDQPTAETVLPAFLNFLGDDVLVAHNLSFDLGFINAELARLRRPNLANPTLCTLRLARRLLRGLKSKGLSSLIEFFGIPVDDRHRALGDARATAVVLQRFLDQLAYEHGLESRDDVLRFQFATYAGKKGAPRRLAKIRTEVLPRLPEMPGVYFMKDRNGQILYVGKAKNLKARVRSYFNAIEAHASRTRNLIESVADVEWTVYDSELEALLEESRLIKVHKPRFNRAQKFYRHRPFLRLGTDEPFPRITLASYLIDDAAEYFGPLAGRRHGELILDLINRFFLLRECDDATFKRKTTCLYEDMHRCSAPCQARERSPASYQAEVQRVKAFLSGHGGAEVLARLEAAMKDAAAAMDFEMAAHYRDTIEIVGGLLEKQRLIAAPVLEHHGVVVDRTIRDGRQRAHVVRYGRLFATHLYPCPAPPEWRDALYRKILDAFSGSVERPERYMKAEIEEVNVLARWLYQHRDAVEKIDWNPSVSLDDYVQRIWDCMRREAFEG